jgi:hypothetical protein
VAKALSGSGAVLRLPCAQAAAQQQRQYLRGGVGAPVRQQHQQRHQQHRPAVHVACSVVGHQPSSSSERDDGAGRRAGNSARHQASPSSAPFISSQQQQQAFADQQPLQPYTPPAWHPRLFGVPRSKRACLEAAATQYYSEVWNGCSVELLDELASDAVCYNDALGLESDAFSRASLKAVVREFQASHPLLHYDVVSRRVLRLPCAAVSLARMQRLMSHQSACGFCAHSRDRCARPQPHNHQTRHRRT